MEQFLHILFKNVNDLELIIQNMEIFHPLSTMSMFIKNVMRNSKMCFTQFVVPFVNSIHAKFEEDWMRNKCAIFKTVCFIFSYKSACRDLDLGVMTLKGQKN